MERQLRGLRYANAKNEELQGLLVDWLPYLDLDQTLEFYHRVDDTWPRCDVALLGCNDHCMNACLRVLRTNRLTDRLACRIVGIADQEMLDRRGVIKLQPLA